MSKMELRSSRSRSRTPFVSQELIESEVAADGNHVEKTVTRTTRRTTVYKTQENASSSMDEINTSRETSSPAKSSSSSTNRKLASAKSERSLRSRIFKTSDYSSEDGGENEVTSSRTVRQNESNQMREDARTLTNGSEMPALDLYRRSGRYWDVYPKTDWTYSHHSKDRVEIAPGVVAMPNMSRKAIHSLDESQSSFESSSHSRYSENVSHKNTNTENTLTSRYSTGLGEEVRRSMYNNNAAEDYFIKRRTSTRWSSFKQTVTTIFSSIFTTIYTLFYYTYKVQTGVFSHIHRAASKVMLWDTYLLWKSRPGDKATKLAFLCLVPLLLFGGVHVYLASGSTFALSCHPNCGKMAAAYFNSLAEPVYRVFSLDGPVK